MQELVICTERNNPAVPFGCVVRGIHYDGETCEVDMGNGDVVEIRGFIPYITFLEINAIIVEKHIRKKRL